MKRAPLLSTTAIWLAAGLLAVGAAGCSKTPNGQTAAAVSEPTSGVGAQSDDGPAVTTAQSDAGSATAASYEVPIPPPALPTYDQPPPPGAGYIWTPGYWGWSDSARDYYWTPGTWVLPPQADDYWTPGYWNYLNDGYVFVPGYWGASVGFYGGVNYGWGYGGNGYSGGRWNNGHFYYNSDANNLGGRQFPNVYANHVGNREGGGTGYNGGPHGVRTRPTSEQQVLANSRHIAPTSAQMRHYQMARQTPDLRAGVNHGRPAIVATARPGAFHGAGVVTQVRSAPHYTPPAMPGRVGMAGARHPGAAPRAGEPAHPMSPALAGHPAERGPAPMQHAPMERAPAHAPMAARPASRPEAAARPEMARPAPRPAMARPAARPEMAPRPEMARPAARPQMASRPAPAPRAAPPRQAPARAAAPHPAAPHPGPGGGHDKPHP